MSMFWTICSFVMFFERQRPIKGLNGTVAFFAQLGNCNYSQWPQWFVTGLTVIPRAVAVKVIADLLRDQYPMGLNLETNVRKAESLKIPHGGPYHDCGRRFNLPIVSFYNPVSEFTFIGPLFSTTPAGGSPCCLLLLIRFLSLSREKPRRLHRSATLRRASETDVLFPRSKPAQNLPFQLVFKTSNAASTLWWPDRVLLNQVG